jgi:16S rRNA (cytosine1402-N4)-methyltransferase
VTFAHVSVLLDELVAAVGPRSGGVYVDATLGGAGHSRALLAAGGPGTRLVGLDRDPRAIAAATERLAPWGDDVVIVKSAFSNIARAVAESGFARVVDGRPVVDGVIADLGVSSPQIDEADRGFSYGNDGPLDMRMSNEGETAAELIDRVDSYELATIFREYGEVPQAGRLAQAVKAARIEGRLNSTRDLAAICDAVLGRADRRHNAATLPFQGLRIAVNDELRELHALLDAIPALLDVGGVAAIISFHSLEDRIVKQRFRALTRVVAPPRGLPVRGDAGAADFRDVGRDQVAGELEVASNPRARSARLRAIRRERATGAKS